MKSKGFILIFSLAVLLGCYYDQEGILYPNSSNCTPSATPFYIKDVKPILDQRCVSCHSGSFPSGNVALDTYAGVLTRINDKSLVGSITQTGSFSPMPKNSSKLSACEINNIKGWVNAGAQNN